MRILFAVLAVVATASALPCLTVTPAGAASTLHGVVLIADQPLGAVLKQIGRRVPGRALDARQVERDGRRLYRVKWLGDDGKVRDVTVDAESGKILQVR